jgi:hypothetical protein
MNRDQYSEKHKAHIEKHLNSLTSLGRREINATLKIADQPSMIRRMTLLNAAIHTGSN